MEVLLLFADNLFRWVSRKKNKEKNDNQIPFDSSALMWTRTHIIIWVFLRETKLKVSLD